MADSASGTMLFFSTCSFVIAPSAASVSSLSLLLLLTTLATSVARTNNVSIHALQIGIFRSPIVNQRPQLQPCIADGKILLCTKSSPATARLGSIETTIAHFFFCHTNYTYTQRHTFAIALSIHVRAGRIFFYTIPRFLSSSQHKYHHTSIFSTLQANFHFLGKREQTRVCVLSYALPFFLIASLAAVSFQL